MIGDLADNRKNVGRFVTETHQTAARLGRARARRSPPACSACPPSCASSSRRWPSSAQATDAQSPALADLNAVRRPARDAASSNLPDVRRREPHRLQVARPSSSRDGRPALRAAQPDDRPSSTASRRTRRSSPTTSAIVLKDLDDRNRAVEKDPRSPGGKGYTGFEALLQYVFDQTMAINAFDSNGYMLKVNLFLSECSDYQNLQSLKEKLKKDPGFYSRCAAILGPQPARASRSPTRATPARRRSHEAPACRPPRRRSRSAPRHGPTSRRTPTTRARPRRPRQGAPRSSKQTARGHARHRAARPAADACPALPPAAGACPRQQPELCRRAGAPRLPARAMKPRPTSNPVLIGAVTVLVTTVAVFLAYNANNGLPFVPTTTVKVRVANGANLVKGNEVRSGGTRIGVVTDMRPVRLDDGSTGAELTLELDKEHGELPARLDAADPPALGARPQVRRARRSGTSEETFAQRRHDAGLAGVLLDRARRGLRDVRRADAQGVAGEPAAASATRSPAAASDVGRTLEELPRAAAARSSR